LIYFIFKGDTYVVLSVFTYLDIIGELAAGVRILLEKGPSRHHISEDQQFQRNIQKFIYYQKTKIARRRKARGAAGGPHHQVARAHPWPRCPGVRPPWPTPDIALSRIWSSPKA
jgi:hypothetical protein